MKSNIVRFMDYQAEDALARLTEQVWQERRAEIIKEHRRMEREKRRKVHWVTNCIMIGTIALAAFCAGLIVGCL